MAKTLISLLITVVWLSLTVLLLNSCAPAQSDFEKGEPESPIGQTISPIHPREEEPSIEEPVTGEGAEAPEKLLSTQLPGPPAIEQPIFPSPSMELPTRAETSPLPTATQVQQPTATQTLFATEEQRSVEIEWPSEMRLGHSDVIRLSLLPTHLGYVAIAEFPEHEIITQTVQITRPGGYSLFAVARIDGVGFEFSPLGDQIQYLSPDEVITWRWSLIPRLSGEQRLSVTLKLRWDPLGENEGALREVVAYSTVLNIYVRSFMGLTYSQMLMMGFIGLFFGSSMGFFALLVRPRETHQRRFNLAFRYPNKNLEIEPPADLILNAQEINILKALFQRYSRLIIREEFLSGYSGARTFLVMPIHSDGRADAYTIAKLGERNAILREFENFENFVKDTLPPITARIQHNPVTIPDKETHGTKLAALQYTFIGEPGSSPTSLRQVLLKKPDPALIIKLLDTFGPNWWLQRKPSTFRMAQEFDCMLPTHFILEPVETSTQVLDGKTPPYRLNLWVGDQVRLQNFPYSEFRIDGVSQSLRGIPAPGQPPLRARWLSLENHNNANSRVIETRYSLLRKLTKECKLYGLPDPINRLEDFLDETISGSISTIHGDLNLENILLGPGNLVWLIDFAQTREGHTLFDFAHLEAEVIAHILSVQISNPSEYLSLLNNPTKSQHANLFRLCQALHEMAERCSFKPTDSREYYLALTITCIGALKFANLDLNARHFLYLTAAFYGASL